MDNDQLRYSTVHFDVRRKLDISFPDYILLDMVYILSGKYGKCYKSTSALANDMGLSFNGVKKMIQRLVDRELMVTDGHTYQVTQAFIDLAYFNKTGRVTEIAQSAKPKKITGVKNDKSLTSSKKDVKDTKIAQSSKKLHKVQSIAQSSDKNKNKELKRTINTTNVVLDEKNDDVGSLYYQAIKSLGLPVMNNTVIKAKIRSIEKEAPHEELVWYLKFMRDQFADARLEFKPSVNTGLDLYTKRVQVINCIKREVERQKQEQVQPIRFGKRSGK